MNTIRQSVCLLLFICISTPVLFSQHNTLPEHFDQWIEEGMALWDIPGLSIAVVHNGEIAHTKGYGVLKAGESATVDADTQFGIASVSKHITASALALLVEQGKITWNDPVINHIPWFKLSDPWVTSQVTIHDILTHQVGIGRILGNRLQFMTKESRTYLLRQMRYHDFEKPFRSEYVYSNVMYTLAGEIVGAVSGKSWDSFISEHFFVPLGMTRTNSSVNDLLENGNVASPHQYIEGTTVVLPTRNWDIASPAGGINSTANDMAKWMLLQLNEGYVHETRFLSEESVQTLQTPKISLPVHGVNSPQNSYGYGYNITDYAGHRMLSHGGATDGMNTTYVLMPEFDLGIIVMTNTFNNFREAIARTIIDHIIGQETRDWSEIYFDSYSRQLNDAMDQRNTIHDSRITGTSPSHSIESFTGLYLNDLYDSAEITMQDNTLILTIFDDPDLSGKLEHWHYNTFRVHWKNPGQREEFVQFGAGFNGNIETVTIRFNLRPLLLQAGAYPSDYTRDVTYHKTQ